MLVVHIRSRSGSPDRREVFDKLEITIGRAPGNDLILADATVWKHHCSCVVRDGKCFLVGDPKHRLGPIYINGMHVAQRELTRHGFEIAEHDRVLLGTVMVSFSHHHPSP